MPMHYQQRGDYGAPDENYDGHSGQSKLNQYNYTSTSSNIQEAPLHSRGMTPEQYEAQRRVATPQRNRHRASSRVPPPGKFASQEQPAQETQPFTQMQPSPAPRRHGYSMSQQQPPSPPSRGQHNQRHYSQQPSSQYAHNYQQNVVYPQNTPQYANQRSSHHHALGPSKEGNQARTTSQKYHFQLQQQIHKYEEERQQAETREDQYNIQFMQEREEEIQDINKKVNQVNDIYSELAGLIDGQQDLIDKVDMNIEESHANAKAGIANYEEARLRLENPIKEDLFGDKLGTKTDHRPTTPREAGRRRVKNAKKKKRKSAAYDSGEDAIDCKTPFETISDDLKEVVNDMKIFGSKMFIACTEPDDADYNEYASRR